MSSALGSSLAAFFWATSMMLLPPSIAASNALMDFGRPTKSGITMCGNTTTSRSGSSGNTVRTDGNRFVDMRVPFPGCRTVAGARPRTQGPAAQRRDCNQKFTLARSARRRRASRSAGAGGDPWLIGVHEDRATPTHRVVVDDDLGDVLHARQVVHHIEEDGLHDRAQAPRAGAAFDRLFRNRHERVGAHLE